MGSLINVTTVLWVGTIVGGSPDGGRLEAKGIVTGSSNYCNGMAPDRETMKALQTPRPIPGRRFDVYRGPEAAGTPATDFATDDQGRYRVSLAPGTWCAVDSTRRIRLGTKPVEGADPSCWAQESKRCDLLIVLKDRDVDLGSMNFVQACGWNQTCGPHTPPPP